MGKVYAMLIFIQLYMVYLNRKVSFPSYSEYVDHEWTEDKIDDGRKLYLRECGWAAMRTAIGRRFIFMLDDIRETGIFDIAPL